MLRRATTGILAVFFAISLLAQARIRRPQPPLHIKVLGQGSVQIDGPWQFHTGDDPRWASPFFDDSTWESISTASTWGSQDHPAYTGFAWYRRRVEIQTIAGKKNTYALLMPQVDDAYEIYWNGVLIGSYGKLPPDPHWYYTSLLHTFPVPLTSSGTVAIRVWKSPLLFVDPNSLGGLYGPPIMGDADTLAAQMQMFNNQSTEQFLYDYALVILDGFVTLFSLLLWGRNRKEQLFLWLAIFTATPILLAILQGAIFHIPILFSWGRGLNQPIYALNHVSLWFLLIWLLRLNGNRTLVRWTWRLATVSLIAGTLDGILAFFWGGAGIRMQWLDAILTALIMVLGLFPFVIIALGFRHHLEPSRWWVAISALVAQMIDVFGDASAAGQRFTHKPLQIEMRHAAPGKFRRLKWRNTDVQLHLARGRSAGNTDVHAGCADLRNLDSRIISNYVVFDRAYG